MLGNAEYSVLLRPLREDDGGGWIAIVPDLPGCFSDGESGEEAFENVRGAIDAWKKTAMEEGRDIPTPDSFMVHDITPRVPDAIRQQVEHYARQLHDQLPGDVPERALVDAILAEFARTALRGTRTDS